MVPTMEDCNTVSCTEFLIRWKVDKDDKFMYFIDYQLFRDIKVLGIHPGNILFNKDGNGGIDDLLFS